MLVRHEVCRQVTSGDINGALAALNENFASVLQTGSNVVFLLHSQKFIEIIVRGASPEDTVAYGRRALSELRDSGDNT